MYTYIRCLMKSLLEAMLSFDPDSRPSMEAALQRPSTGITADWPPPTLPLSQS